jgi:hypothetical protein
MTVSGSRAKAGVVMAAEAMGLAPARQPHRQGGSAPGEQGPDGPSAAPVRVYSCTSRLSDRTR